MHKLKIAFAFIIFSVSAISAMADTDYRCLTQCVNNGRTSVACLKECSYNVAPTPAPSAGGQNSLEFSHRQFSAPAPLNSGTLLPPVRTNHTSADKDYVCMARCQQNGMQYQFCEEQCTKNKGASVMPDTSHPNMP